MTKFYDGKKVLSISLKDNDGVDFTSDFFNAGSLAYDESKEAYKVDDVDYLVDYATSYAAGKNPDFDNFGDDTKVCDVWYDVK